jgi:hypothetical protein
VAVTVIDVTSGTSATITALTTDATISNWRSSATGAKTQTIPAAGAVNNGFLLTVADSEGTAGIYPITIMPASGSIGPGAVISSPYGAITLRSDGNNANWIVVGRG